MFGFVIEYAIQMIDKYKTFVVPLSNYEQLLYTSGGRWTLNSKHPNKCLGIS